MRFMEVLLGRVLTALRAHRCAAADDRHGSGEDQSKPT
jgi:hypothetical protein